MFVSLFEILEGWNPILIKFAKGFVESSSAPANPTGWGGCGAAGAQVCGAVRALRVATQGPTADVRFACRVPFL